MKKVLLTGFDPFGGYPINSALEAIKQFKNKRTDDWQITVLEVPTIFGKSIDTLRRAMEEEQPDVVISVGQAGGRSEISLERVAINVNDARIPDNEGQRPIDTPIIAGGPTAYWSTLPIKAIVQNIRQSGIPAAVSNTAGTFVCNHLFYGLAHLIATEYPSVRGGFIHIPYLPEQVAERPHLPSMSLENILHALEIAIRTSVELERDIVAGGGKIC